MDREIPVAAPKLLHQCIEHFEMAALVFGDFQPVVVIRPRHPREAVGVLEREIDRTVFDMRDRVQQKRLPLFRRGGLAPGNVLRRHDLAHGGVGGLFERCRLKLRFENRFRLPVGGIKRPEGGDLFRRIGGAEYLFKGAVKIHV